MKSEQIKNYVQFSDVICTGRSRQIVLILLGCIAVLLSFTTSVLATAYNGYYNKKTGNDFEFYDAMAPYGTPVIDGKAGTGEWNSSYSREIYKYDRDDNRIRYMFQYDAVNLYILIEVDDDRIWDDSQGEIWETNRDDGVEIYIDPDNSRDSFLTRSDRVIAFTVTGKNYRFDQGNNAGSTEYYGEFTNIKKAVGINGTVNNPSDTDSGYLVEVAVPWKHLGGTYPAGGVISLNVIVVEDDDGGDLNINYDESQWDEPFEIDRYFKWFGDGLSGPSNYARVMLLPATDSSSPSAVNDISFSNTNPFSTLLSFTAPVDNPASGETIHYLIRYSKKGAISSESDWISATPFDNSFIPKIAGRKETLRITGLEPATGYYFSVRAEDSHGNISPLSTLSSGFFMTTSSAPQRYGRGRVYPSPSGRYFTYEDGTRFLPVTEPAGITWVGIRDLYNFSLWDPSFSKLVNWHESIEADSELAKKFIKSLAEHGVNVLRIFIEDLAFANSENPYAPDAGVSYLEFPATSGGSSYVEETLTFLDDFMTLCAEYNIYVTVTPFDTYFYKDYWAYNPYNIANGGMISSPDQFVTDPNAVAAQKKRLEVLYGILKKHYNFFGWEMMNEWDNNTYADLTDGWESERIPWMKDMATYLRSVDNDSMIFISSVNWQPQFDLKDFLLQGDYFDFVAIHNYTKSVKDPSLSGDRVTSIRPALDSRRIVEYMVGNTADSRPVLDLEFGPISVNSYSAGYTLEDDEEVFHNIIWSEFASGAGGMGLRWPGKTLEYNGPRLSDNMMLYQKNMADYFSQTGLDLPNMTGSPWERNVKIISNLNGELLSGGAQGKIKVFATSDGKSGMIYLLHDTRISTGSMNATARIYTLENDGKYRVELWNTRSQGQTVSSQDIQSASGVLAVPLPLFTNDCFVSFYLQSADPSALSAPKLSVNISALKVAINWNIPDGADGVRLYYAPADLSYIGSFDMGRSLLPTLDLFGGFDYYIAVTAYRENGTESEFSNIERITIP